MRQSLLDKLLMEKIYTEFFKSSIAFNPTNFDFDNSNGKVLVEINLYFISIKPANFYLETL